MPRSLGTRLTFAGRMRFALKTMWNGILYRLRSISLIWKLLIPFLAFAFIGTTSLVYLGLNSQQRIMAHEDAREMKQLYRLFLRDIRRKEELLLALASALAVDPEIERLTALQDRQAVERYAEPIFQTLGKKFGIEQFHVDLSPGEVSLHVHRAGEQGQLTARPSVMAEALKSRDGISGLEQGPSGLELRGTAPIVHDGKVLGSLEIRYPINTKLLSEFKRRWGADLGIYARRGKSDYVLLGCTDRNCMKFRPEHYSDAGKVAGLTVLSASGGHPPRSILFGPLKDHIGDAAAVVFIAVDRSATIRRVEERRNLMLLIAVAGIVVSFCLTWFVASRFVKPITEIVREAREIAEGKRESRLQSRPDDEIGHLSRSLNVMLAALKERREKIEEYAQTLEDRVRERTADLVASEEKYRALVEHVPLIVYRILADGTTEFINLYFTDQLGYSPDEVVGDRNFWREKICGWQDRDESGILEACWGKGQELRAERKVRTKDGKTLTFIDQAIPFTDNRGNIRWIDGIMMDITELKRYQEQALQAEEIRVLGEISARLAHEIRNPLTTAGGFARRLAEKLPEDDPNRKAACIIAEDVGRLEEILRMMLQSIEPVTITVEELDVSSLIDSLLEEHTAEIVSGEIRMVKSLPENLPSLAGDAGLLTKALDSLIRHSILSTPRGSPFFVRLQKEGDSILITFRHPAEGISDEDLEQFFLPRLPFEASSRVLDLPLSRIIVNKHGGKIDIFREEQDMIVVRVVLPIRSPVLQG